MQQAIQKAHEWTQNLNSQDVKIYLDELSGNSLTFSEDPSRMRSVKTKHFKIILPVYVDVEQEIGKLKQAQMNLLTDYVYVVNELTFGNRDDVIMKERYEVLAKRLSRIQHNLLAYQQYSNLNPGHRNAMIHPPHITKISKPQRKSKVHKGGGNHGIADRSINLLPPQLGLEFGSADTQKEKQVNDIKAKVKSLLRSKYAEKI